MGKDLKGLEQWGLPRASLTSLTLGRREGKLREWHLFRQGRGPRVGEVEGSNQEEKALQKSGKGFMYTRNTPPSGVRASQRLA